MRRVRLTGGEPTVRPGLPALVGLLRAIPGLDEIALSTNGHLLERWAAPLRSAGVDRLNVSLDSLDGRTFRALTRGGDLARVLAGLDAAAGAGFGPIKINTVAIKGVNDGELAALCDFAWARGFVPRFIEEMPMAAGRTYQAGTCLSAAEIRAAVAAIDPGGRVVDDDGGRARGGGPARYFRLTGTAPVRRFGIISPMTEHFCASCNRLRLSASGALHACLGHDDAVDLRAPLRTGDPEAVRAAIRRALAGKRAEHLRPDRNRRPTQGDGTDRRMRKDADLKQRVAGLDREFEDRLAALVGIATVSMDPGRRSEMDACVALAGGYLREAGARVEVIDTGGFPMLLGRFIQDPSFPTVTVYNHLDVQPAEAADGWRTPPFQLTRADQAGGPRRWFARGATDDKGPALTALYGARLALESGAKVNIQFLWELEEEIGSPHFAAGLAAAIAGDPPPAARRW